MTVHSLTDNPTRDNALIAVGRYLLSQIDHDAFAAKHGKDQLPWFVAKWAHEAVKAAEGKLSAA